MSEGIEPLGKNHIEMSVSVYLVAYTPPLLLLKPAPKLAVLLVVTSHPTLAAWFGSFTQQSYEVIEPDMGAFVMLQP